LSYLPHVSCSCLEYERHDGRAVVPNIEGVRDQLPVAMRSKSLWCRYKLAPCFAGCAEAYGEPIRNLTAQVVERSSKAADLRARLQLTERTQSSLEEEARTLREEGDYLRAELEDERSMGFFRRLLGG
jgi:hypothetical protein